MSKEHSSMISTTAKKWLNSFSDQVDFYRFQNGVLLFNKNHITEIDITPIGFKGVVLGSKSEKYDVSGDFILNGYFPDIRNLLLTCSCPDDVPICKHGVCVVCYLITYFEKLAKQNLEPTGGLIDLQKCEEILDSLKSNITPNDVNVLNLPNEGFWPFQLSFNDAIKDIDSILVTLLSKLNK